MFIPCRRPPLFTLFPYTTLFRSIIVLPASVPAACTAGLHASNLTAEAHWHESDFRLAAAENHFQDRKSTRLNSSHVEISYAVFCLKKKNTRKTYIFYALAWSYRR